MKWYIAGGDQERAKRVRSELESKGHSVLASWIDCKNFKQPKEPQVRAVHAGQCFFEIELCDALVVLCDGELGKGGKHIECGFALGLNLPVWLTGKLENTMQYSDRFRKCENDDHFLHLTGAA